MPRVCARPATMRFAIEPMRSRFPAKVELMARTRHIKSGLGMVGTVWRHRMTAGTFEIRFDRVAITPLTRSEEHTSELQSLTNLVCRLLLEKKKNTNEHTRM